jgi:SOS-response transcriptional repressor LexA
MDISRDQILTRLTDRLAELKMTENEASTRAGLERTFLSQLRRNPGRWPRVDNLQRICDALGLRMYWVTTGCGPRLTGARDYGADVAEVPFGSWVAATGFSEPTTLERDGGDLSYLPVPGLPRGDFLALRVVGDSMNLVAPENSVIVVDRADTLLHPRGFYVFATADRGEATFKRWMSRPDRLEPYSTNPAHETIYLDTPPTVVGRVRKVMLDL